MILKFENYSNILKLHSWQYLRKFDQEEKLREKTRKGKLAKFNI